MEKDCIICGKSFSKKPNHSRKYWAARKLCSRKCSRDYQAGKSFTSGDKISEGLKKAYAENRRTSYFREHEAWNKGTKGVVKAWNKGLKTGIVPKSAFKKGHTPPNPFAKGQVPWNKGIVWEELRGDKHPNWKGGKPRQQRRETLTYEDNRRYMDWRKAVFTRDNWECVMCGHHGGVLHADHIKSWVDHIDTRFIISNGRTLCPPCHRSTPTYGRHRQLQET